MRKSILLLLLLLSVCPLLSQEAAPVSIDSLVNRICRMAPIYRDTVQEYHAGLYVRAHLNIPKKNFLFRYIPQILNTEKDVDNYLLETYRDVHYVAPGFYDQQLRYIHGTVKNQKNIPGILNYFQINIYAPYLIGDALLSPLAPNARRHYHYRLDSITPGKERNQYHITFIPKNKSYQLLHGQMTVQDSTWSVSHINFQGRSDLLRFHCSIQMGQPGSRTEFLPVDYDISASYALAWNRLDGRYRAHLTYSSIHEKTEEVHSGYDLSTHFLLSYDLNASKQGEKGIEQVRAFPLSPHEEEIYQSYHNRHDSLRADTGKADRKKHFWKIMEPVFLQDYKLNVHEYGTFRCTPFVNPLLLSYSKSNGLAYRQRLQYQNDFSKRHALLLRANLGYNFTRKEFYWQLHSAYSYWPEHCGSLQFTVGNGNRIYSSDVLEDIQSMTDSILNFDKLHLNYFKDLNISITNELEIINGLTLSVGAIMHRRSPVHRPEIIPENENDILETIRPCYVSFAPRFRVEWTPHQYYYINNNKKYPLYSRYPTFAFDYERGLRNVFGSTGVYERMELEMQHSINFGVHNRFYYRFGLGGFTNQEETYFVDFAHLTRKNLPYSWSDDIGGVFQNLDSRWYNASSQYIRLNTMLEAPFLLMHHLGKHTGHIRHERLYFNILTMRHLPAHIELGYGIGTFIFDTGIFGSYNVSSGFGIGYKFEFELFR